MGTKTLKILGIIQAISTVIAIALAIAVFSNVMPEFNNQLMQAFNAQGDASNSSLLPGIILLMTGVFQLFQTWLLFRAAKDPRKSTLLLVLTVLSIISALINMFTQKFDSSQILSLVINVIIVIAIFSAKKQAEWGGKKC